MIDKLIRYFDLQSEYRPSTQSMILGGTEAPEATLVTEPRRDAQPLSEPYDTDDIQPLGWGTGAPEDVSDQGARVDLPIKGRRRASFRHAAVLPQYLAVAAGVFVEPFLRKYVANGAWPADGSDLIGRAIFGLVIGIILLPAVYKSAFDPQKPVLVQLAALFPLGIGWQSLFSTATKIALP